MNKTFSPSGSTGPNAHNQSQHHLHQHAMPMAEQMPMAMHMPMKLARAYVLSQPYTGLFMPDKALKLGTVFPNLFEAFPEIR